jgi:hypothetical protein
MELTVFNYLTDLEKKKVRRVFQGWKREYLESLQFRKVEDGWQVRDESLRATVYMHIRNNGHKTT